MNILQRLFCRADGQGRGTLTLLPDGQTILGLPTNTTAQAGHEAAMVLREWLASTHGLAVFPFPLDVVDKRAKR